jgi:hypothetical protein
MKSDLIELAVQLHAETEKAWLVSDDGEAKNAVWIPKSQAEIEPKGKHHILTCPEWLALDKRLI